MSIINRVVLSAPIMCMTACSYTNHFLDEEAVAPSADYDILVDLDATAYDCWTYVNLETGQTERHPDTGEWYYAGSGLIRNEQAPPSIGMDWHIAVHRYEFRTNNAEVLNTHVPDMAAVKELPYGEYMRDETVCYHDELKVTGGVQYLLVMDMSEMIDGNIGYALNGTINRVLCDAVTRTATGSMPPILYGSTGEVLVLKFADGNWATLKIFKTYGGSDGARSGMMSFQYKFHRP